MHGEHVKEEGRQVVGRHAKCHKTQVVKSKCLVYVMHNNAVLSVVLQIMLQAGRRSIEVMVGQGGREACRHMQCQAGRK